MEESKPQYDVRISRKVLKSIERLPERIQNKFRLLAMELRDSGPIQRNWSNFSALGKGKFHCHLTQSYVACWRHDKGTIVIEVYYVGSRQGAPY